MNLETTIFNHFTRLQRLSVLSEIALVKGDPNTSLILLTDLMEESKKIVDLVKPNGEENDKEKELHIDPNQGGSEDTKDKPRRKAKPKGR